MNSKIYTGEVTHERVSPVAHRFRYPFYFYGFDLDELTDLDRSNPLFGYNRFRPVALHDRDYLTPDAGSVREKLDRLLRQHGMAEPVARVELITAARYFNYVFNPVSFFYCYRPDGRLVCIVTQVNNTFGDTHIYLLRDPDCEQGVYRFSDDKVFHVSPFFPRTGRYDFVLSPPGEKIDIMLNYRIGDDLQLVARMNGSARPLNRRTLAATLLQHPLCAALTMPRILWQAARLRWQRRLPVHPRPVPSSPMTVRSAPPTLTERLGRKTVLSFFDRLPQGELTVILPDGTRHLSGVAGSALRVRIEVRDPRFFRRLMLSGDIGFGESYTDGDWTTPDLPGLLTLLAANEEHLDDDRLGTALAGRLVNFARHLWRPNTIRGSARNIREHYDLSNDFFATFLDPTMTYSCALFGGNGDSLEQAQRNKLHAVIEKARLGRNDHVLEIGCGWGGFAIEAARRTGCRVSGITVSPEQLGLARGRVRQAGLAERVDIRLCDYRHVEGRYSKIVSIEMLEAVGHAGLISFFRTCDTALEPGGRVVIQVIIIDDARYDTYRRRSDWIRKHIFPGGHLPSAAIMRDIVERHTTLEIREMETFGRHYARTLAFWRQRLLGERERILAMGFDESFIRKWEYYFAYCEAGFNTGKIDLVQMVLTRSGE